MKKIVNGIEVEMPPEEISEMEAWRTPTFDQLKESRKAESAQKRYEKETAGVTVNGRLFLTAREDVRILESAMDKIRRGLVSEVSWKCGDGVFIQLRADNIDNIETAMLVHIQTAFVKEAEYIIAIEACTTIEELAAIELIY